MSIGAHTDPRDAYAIVAEFNAKPGMEMELRNVTLPLVAQARGEPSILCFFLHEDRDRPGHFIFYEVYTSQSDFEEHRAKPHVQEWLARLPEFAAGDVKVLRMAILDARAPFSGPDGDVT